MSGIPKNQEEFCGPGAECPCPRSGFRGQKRRTRGKTMAAPPFTARSPLAQQQQKQAILSETEVTTGLRLGGHDWQKTKKNKTTNNKQKQTILSETEVTTGLRLGGHDWGHGLRFYLIL